MRQRTSRSTRILALLLAGPLATALGACAGTDRGTVTVLASWTGAEQAAFQQVLDRFSKQTGIRVHYEGTRALDQVLVADVQQGTTPDIAILPGLGDLAGYARQGALHPLDDMPSKSQGSSWRGLETFTPDPGGKPHRYAVAVKATLKSLIWYNPKRMPSFQRTPPPTWDKLVEASTGRRNSGQTPWCMGMGSPPVSGWPGTDWIEDILLHQSGTSVYEKWASGRFAWHSPEVQRAWTTWGTLAVDPGMVYGGRDAALLTDFNDAGRPMFTDPPGCLLHHQASFSISDYRGYDSGGGLAQPGTDFDFFPFPDIPTRGQLPPRSGWEVSADLAGMFTDTPQARQLIRYLATDEAQQTWLAASRGAFFSVNTGVTTYDNEVSGRIAAILTGRETLCVDASDLMPTEMSHAFIHAVLEYLQHPEYLQHLDRLDRLLARLDQVREAVQGEGWPDVHCSGS